MKIPESVRISGVDYAIEYVDNLRQDNQLLYGQIDYGNCKIRLSETDGIGEDFRGITLWHEIMHGILYDRGVELEKELEEVVCEAMSRGVYQVLSDNLEVLY